MREPSRTLRRQCLTLTLAALCGVLAIGANAAPANPKIEMLIEKRGKIVIELLPKDAPKTVQHILELVNKHFYDGILFHRVLPGFVAQAGDPASRKVDPATIADVDSGATGLGAGGSGKTVPLEANAAHDRGTLGLARSNDPNSGDSQFFFNLVPNHRLDAQYTVFGKVVSGIDVMDKIHQGDRITSVKVLKPAAKS